MARSTAPRHPSVRLLIQRRPNHTEPEEIIRECARALVRKATALQWKGPPFDLDELASLRDIKVDRVPPNEVSDATLVPDVASGELTIRPNKAMPDERQRFNIGHEITHTFFPDCAQTVRLRGGPPGENDAEVEALCDIGAAEMLFPLEPFLQDVRELGGPSLSAIAELRERYRASWEATANRMVSTASVPCAVVVLTLRLKPTEERAMRCNVHADSLSLPKLRVDYAILSSYIAGVFVPKHKSIPDNSILYDLVRNDLICRHLLEEQPQRENWSEQKIGPVWVTGRLLPSSNTGDRVLAFVKPASSTRS